VKHALIGAAMALALIVVGAGGLLTLVHVAAVVPGVARVECVGSTNDRQGSAEVGDHGPRDLGRLE
jgi:hypothetical protein